MTVSAGVDLPKAYKNRPFSFCLHRGYGFRARDFVAPRNDNPSVPHRLTAAAAVTADGRGAGDAGSTAQGLRGRDGCARPGGGDRLGVAVDDGRMGLRVGSGFHQQTSPNFDGDALASKSHA